MRTACRLCMTLRTRRVRRCSGELESSSRKGNVNFRRIKINRGEQVELYLRKPGTKVFYSAVSTCNDLQTEPQTKTAGLKASMTIVGPGSICIVHSKKTKSTTMIEKLVRKRLLNIGRTTINAEVRPGTLAKMEADFKKALKRLKVSLANDAKTATKSL
jgi:hypothetical protein